MTLDLIWLLGSATFMGLAAAYLLKSTSYQMQLKRVRVKTHDLRR